MKSSAALSMLLRGWILAILCLAAVAAWGEEEKETNATELSRIIVTGTRHANSNYDTPNAISVVTPTELARRMPFGAIDALFGETGIVAQKTTNGQGSPKIRSFTGYHTLILVDGVRLNNSTFRSGPNQYFNTLNVDDLEQIEVIRGPMSVLYGNSALGGVIHARSPLPRRSGETFELRPRIFGRWGAAGENGAGGVSVEGGVGNFDMRGLFSRKTIGDVNPGKGLDVHLKGNKFILTREDYPATVPKTMTSDAGKSYEVTHTADEESPTNYTENAGSLSLGWRLNDASGARLVYQGLQQKNPTRWDQVASRDRNVFFRFAPQERHLVYGNYRIEKPLPAVESIAATLSFHRQEEGQISLGVGKDPPKDTKSIRDTVNTVGVALTASSPLPKQLLTYGVDVYHDTLDSEQLLPTPKPYGRYTDGSTATDANAFLQDEIAITDALAAIVGGNVTRYAIESDLSARNAAFGVLKNDGTAVTGSVALSYELMDGLKVHTGVGRGFRAPSLDDLSAVQFANVGIQAPSPGVSPESSLNVEAGVKMRQQRFGGSLTAFQTALNGQMIQRPYTEVEWAKDDPYYAQLQTENNNIPVFVLDNVDESVVRGLEADVYVSPLTGWTLYGNGAYTRGEVLKINGKDPDPAKPWERNIRAEPPLMGTVGVRWEPVSGRAWGEVFARGAAKQNRLNATDVSDARIPGLTAKAAEVTWNADGTAVDAGTPGWVTLNLRGGVNLLGDLTRLTVGVENLFDRRYREHHSGVDAPGRNFLVSIDNRF